MTISHGSACVAIRATRKILPAPWRAHRRKPNTQRQCSIGGVYDFPARPSLSGLEQSVFWVPEADTSVVHIGPAPDLTLADPRFLADIRATHEQASIEGLHIACFTESGHVQLIVIPGLKPDQPIGAIVPLDAYGLDRIQALIRLWKSLHGLSVPPDTRMTAQQRRRLKNMLRAVDGRMNDADYRQIAEVIFGVERVAADPWKTSALRDVVLDLVKDGYAMIDGGYRKLLRHRRRS